MPHPHTPAAEQATERFYRVAWPLRAVVLRTARFLTRDIHEAEDLAQETMLKAFRFIDRFTEGTEPQAWLMTILRNTRIDRLRAAGRQPTVASLDALETDPPATATTASGGTDSDHAAALTADEILNDFADQDLIDGLQSLPDEIRFTLLLVNVQELDHTQAAAIMGIPAGTVKSRASRGRAMLREFLAARSQTARKASTKGVLS